MNLPSELRPKPSRRDAPPLFLGVDSGRSSSIVELLTALARTSDLQQLWPEVARRFRDVIQFDRLELALFCEDGVSHSCSILHEPLADASPTRNSFVLNQGSIAGLLLATREPLLILEYDQASGSPASLWLERNRLRSGLALSLAVPGKGAPASPFGVLLAGSRRALAFTRRDLEVARTVATHMDLAVERCTQWTDLQTLHAQLQASERQFHLMVDSIPQLAWMADQQCNSFWFNRRWYDYTGATTDESVGLGWQSFLHPAILPEADRRSRAALQNGQSFEMIMPIRGADGTYRTFLTRSVPVPDEHGKPLYWFGTSTDISDQLQAEEALRRTEKLAVVGRLASSIAHEINNPLSSVTNLLYLLRDEPNLSQQGRQFLELAEIELNRATHIATETLRFYREPSGPALADLGEIMDAVLSLHAMRIRATSVRIHREYRNRGFLCHVGELRQLMANLLANALDAMPAGGDLKIRLREASCPTNPLLRGIRLTLADNGPGMSPDLKHRIFEAFFTTKSATGTGLGLWIADGIVRKHSGTMRVLSSTRPGASGTAFSIFLPYPSLKSAVPDPAFATPQEA